MITMMMMMIMMVNTLFDDCDHITYTGDDKYVHPH